MKGGRVKNIAGRVINIIDRVIEALDQVQEREAKLKDAELKAKATSGTALKDDPKYKKYFKMLSMHLPRGAVEQKMIADGLDAAILDLDPDQPAPGLDPNQSASNSMKVSGEPVANPFAGRQGPMSGLLDGIRKQQGKPQQGKSSNTPHRRAKKKAKTNKKFSLNNHELAKRLSMLRPTKNRNNSVAPLAPRPMSIVDNLQLELQHTLNGKRREYNNAAPKIPREIPEKKPTKSEVVIEKGNEFHIIGVNSINGKITKHMGVVQNINKEKYDVQIKGSDTVLDDILLENQLKEILEIDDIVIFQDTNSSIKFGKVDRVDRNIKTIRVQIDQIDDKKKTAWLSHDTRIKCDKDIKRGYKLMKKLDDIYYYGVPYNLLESCESLSDDDIVIDEEKTFSFLFPTKS